MEIYTDELTDAYEDSNGDQIQFKDSTYDIVSKVAYLIGIPLHIFDHEHEPPKRKIYDRLEKDKNARIVRNLCIVRNAIARKYKYISQKMKYQYAGLLSMPEYIPQKAVDQLTFDGIHFYKSSNTRLHQHIVEINRILSDRINNCKSIFPVWLSWEYIRELIIMPKGLSESGVKEAFRVFYDHLDCYPYQVYINWHPRREGNILYDDKKFVTLLYQWHNDYFEDYSKVSDAGNFIKNSIYDFIEDADNVVMVVDCENSDPYRLSAALKSLDSDIIGRIQKIMLFDDVNTVDAWRILESHTQIPVDHIMTERVLESKSLVDIELTAITCREHYMHKVDSFIIVSSDSDYWGLISTLPEARFLVMIEREKCSPDMKAALSNGGIFYCYIDDFYSGDGDDLKKNALFNELYRSLDKALNLNVMDMLDAALVATRIDMSTAARRQFYDKYIRQMRLVIDDDGNASIEFNRK